MLFMFKTAPYAHCQCRVTESQCWTNTSWNEQENTSTQQTRFPIRSSHRDPRSSGHFTRTPVPVPIHHPVSSAKREPVSVTQKASLNSMGILKHRSSKNPATIAFRGGLPSRATCTENFVQITQEGESPGLGGAGGTMSYHKRRVKAVARCDHRLH